MSIATAPSDEHASSREADSELLKAVMAGDGTAYRGIVEKYQNRLYAMIYGMLRNREDARDVTQEAFVKAYRNLDSFRLEASFYTWLYRIALNLAIDFLRKNRRNTAASFDEKIASRDDDGGISEAHDGEGPSKQLERKRLFHKLMHALEFLSDDQRQVLLLRELEGFQYREIAEIMGVPEGTVMSRLFYARKKLQQVLAEGGFEDDRDE